MPQVRRYERFARYSRWVFSRSGRLAQAQINVLQRRCGHRYKVSTNVAAVTAITVSPRLLGRWQNYEQRAGIHLMNNHGGSNNQGGTAVARVA